MDLNRLSVAAAGFRWLWLWPWLALAVSGWLWPWLSRWPWRSGSVLLWWLWPWLAPAAGYGSVSGWIWRWLALVATRADVPCTMAFVSVRVSGFEVRARMSDMFFKNVKALVLTRSCCRPLRGQLRAPFRTLPTEC